jgi:hypothetical protein
MAEPKKQNKIVKIAKRLTAAVKQGVNIDKSVLYNFSTSENREATALYLYDYARMERLPWVAKWKKYDNYYNGKHDTMLSIAESNKKNDIPFIPACVQDPFMHVEAMIIPDVPDFEFNGRDDDLDSYRAKQREYVVKYILERNKIENKNTQNERRLNKLGDAFWKVYWDWHIVSPDGKQGDIVIKDVDPSNIFPDPAAHDLSDAEYVFYVYRLHKRLTARVYSEDLKKLGMTVDDFGGDYNYSDTRIYNSHTQDFRDDTVQITEFWYKDDNGDIACSILINSQEIRFIPQYWDKTHTQCKLFPFVKYGKILDENNFWDKSELESIIDLTDAADREMAYGLVNAAYTSNDMVIVEEGALADGETLNNAPGAIIHAKANRSGGIKRVGGLNAVASREGSITFLQSQIEKTIGNFDTSMGVEPARVTTASGIAQLNERADSRKDIKKADRLSGFERLYELVDWSALEFYDDNRLIFINATDGGLKQKFSQDYQTKVNEAKQAGQPIPPMPKNLDPNTGPIIFHYSSDNLANKKNIGDEDNPQIETYFPRVDAVVIAGDSLTKSKAFTVQMLQQLLQTPINLENYKLVEAWIDLMNLSNRKEIKDYIEAYFKNMPVGIPKVTMAFKDLPPEGKVQEAAKVGLQLQTPPPADSQNVPWAQLQGGAPTSGIVTDPVNVTNPQPPQGQPQGQQVDPQIAQELNDILSNAHVHLTSEELQHLQQHPEILEEMLKGGSQNG